MSLGQSEIWSNNVRIFGFSSLRFRSLSLAIRSMRNSFRISITFSCFRTFSVDEPEKTVSPEYLAIGTPNPIPSPMTSVPSHTRIKLFCKSAIFKFCGSLLEQTLREIESETAKVWQRCSQ